MGVTMDYAIMAMTLLVASGVILTYLPVIWWVDFVTVPFGGMFSLAVLDRLSRGV